MAPKYIDSSACEAREGEAGFLIERSNDVKGWTRWSITFRPAHTNQSHCPRLEGWCGTTNDVAVHARGLARAVRVLPPANERVEIQPITDPEEVERILNALGYPELTP